MFKRHPFWNTAAALIALASGMYLVQSTFAQQSALPVLKTAPELHEGVWLNSETPLKLQNLRGSVVLLEMWTFGCINCIHTLPSVIEWHDTYQEAGLVVIGNHYPEFSYEADLNNLRDALVRMGITYPVVQDNGRETWDAYENRYWPTIYLIDKQGNLRYKHIGEGAYDRTEAAIQALLAEAYTPDEEATAAPVLSISPTDEVNVRSGPGTGYSIIGRLLPGESTYVLETADGWYRIRFDDTEAYVSARYVTLNEIE